MSTLKILKVPPGHSAHADPRIDRVEIDGTIDQPVVVTEDIPSGDENIVDRRRISANSKQTVADQQRAIESAKAAGDLQAQVDALELMVEDLWNIVSGKTVSETESNHPEQA